MKYFEKFDKDLINNRNLNSHEKLIYIICKSFEKAPRGARISHKYLMQRTGIKTKKTLIKALDNLSLYGLMARKQIGQGTCHYVFDKPTMQEYIRHNINKRKKISLTKNRKFKSYMDTLNNPQVIQINKFIKE
nr:hypothetical protein [uncultured Mediterranean phage uvMED]BAR31614.1 hypothetical protein [uncultured Mediterranean phage uvMED]